MQFANACPIEKSRNVEQIAKLLASDDRRYFADGILISDGGQYAALGTDHKLLRAVTRTRTEQPPCGSCAEPAEGEALTHG
jgi:hypothetical protein